MTKFPYQARTSRGHIVTVLFEDGDVSFWRYETVGYGYGPTSYLTPRLTPESIAIETAENFSEECGGLLNPIERAELAEVIVIAAKRIAGLS